MNEQMAKLQLKHNTEMEFLDDIRSVLLTRATLEGVGEWEEI